MNVTKVYARFQLLGLALLASVLVVGCYPVKLEASWPGIGTVGDQKDILVAYHDRIVMIDPTDGKPVELRNADGEVRLDDQGNARIWEFMGTEGQGSQFYATPIQLDENTLLAATYKQADNRVYEVDLPTARIGAEVINVPGHVVADPVLHNELVYVGMSERNLIAYDTSDMSERWRIVTEHGIWSQPLLVDETLYFTSLDHFLYAVDANTGDEQWKVDLQGASAGAPIESNGHLYVGSFARKIFDISLDGEILGEYETQDWVWGSLVVADGVLYIGDMSGMVYAVDVSEGGFSEVWKAKIAERAIHAPALIHDDYAVVGSRDHKVYWLNRTDGSVVNDVNGLRIRPLSGEVLSDLLLIEPSETVDIPEPYVIVSSAANDNLLMAFTLADGKHVWTYGR